MSPSLQVYKDTSPKTMIYFMKIKLYIFQIQSIKRIKPKLYYRKMCYQGIIESKSLFIVQELSLESYIRSFYDTTN